MRGVLTDITYRCPFEAKTARILQYFRNTAYKIGNTGCST